MASLLELHLDLVHLGREHNCVELSTLEANIVTRAHSLRKALVIDLNDLAV